MVVGTDHHPFDRAVGWADEWAASHPDLRVLVQYGTSRPPTTADGHDLLLVGDLMALMSEATAVVCHGGPGTIMAAREAGHVPIVVPRRSDLGERSVGINTDLPATGASLRTLAGSGIP